jgi:exodeoxyribonuclease VII large subunit
LGLPPVIQRIAVISSANSAGAEDFRHTLLNNSYGYHFFIDDYFTAVQGVNNAREFLGKIIEVFNSGVPYDALVITRGGGAQTDFLIFDDYQIGRAVAKFPIPVITGIGHQKNETITDLMAHTQTKTPTQAAEFIISRNRSFEENLLRLQKNIVIKSQQIFSAEFRALAQLNSAVVNTTRDILARNKDQLVRINRITTQLSQSILHARKNALVAISSQLLSRPTIILYNRKSDIANLAGNIRTFQSQYLKNQAGYLRHYSSVIKMMSPDNILKKGFAMVRSGGRITSNPDDMAVGGEIDIILSDTQISSTITKKTKYDGSDFNL